MEATPTYVTTRQGYCNSLADGKVVETANAAQIRYTYEAAVKEQVLIQSVLDLIEKHVALFVGRELMNCDDDGRRLEGEDPEQRRRLSGFGVVGIDPERSKDEVQAEECRYFANGNAIEGTSCYVVAGSMTLYLSEEDSSEPWRRNTRELALADNIETSSESALVLIKEAMNKDEPPFLEQTGGQYSVTGLMGVRFINGATNGGEDIEGGDGIDYDDTEEKSVAGVKSSSENQSNSNLTAVGGALLAVGIAAILLMALVVVRKRRSRADQYNEFEDDEGDFDDKGTDMDTASMSSSPPPNRKRAYVIGEGDASVATGATHNTTFLHTSYESGNGNDDGNQVDVHHCTSAVCPICTGKQTVFVNALEADEPSVDDEGYEFSVAQAASVTRSFEYEPKGDVVSPSFDNPAGIERPYVVEDTIDF